MSNTSKPLDQPFIDSSQLSTSSEVVSVDVGVDEGAATAKKVRKRKRKKKDMSEVETSAPILSPTSPPPPAPGNTLFIEGLPYTLPPSTLTKFFKDAGFTLLEQRLPTWQDNPNRLRGFGHVVFESEDQAKKAIKELNGKQLPGHSRYITLKTANLPKAETQRPVRSQPEGCTSIHIRNLPYTITEDDVEKVFSEFGKITPNGIRLPLNLQNQPKGFGYVTYLSSSSALAAANKASKPYGVVVNGRPVFVDFDEKGLTGVKDSFRTKEGKVWNREMKNERREFGKEEKDGGGKEGKEKKEKKAKT